MGDHVPDFILRSFKLKERPAQAEESAEARPEMAGAGDAE